jgi:hypothetical protein
MPPQTFYFLFILVLLVFCSCNKEEINWNLKRGNSWDIKHGKPCDRETCESLNGFTRGVYKISPSSTADWYVGEGYSGNGFALTQSCYGGYIEFSVIATSPSKLSFWTKSGNPGYPNRMPEVIINGSIMDAYLIESTAENSDWIQLETGRIESGIHTVRIDFTPVSTYYSYFIDELEIWCELSAN